MNSIIKERLEKIKKGIVPEGYKKTMVGIIPEDWEVKNFENVFIEMVDYRGKTPKKVDSGIILLTAKNIKKGYIDFSESREYINKNDYREVMRRGTPKKGDIVITTEAPMGNVALLDDDNVAIAQRVIKLSTKNLKSNEYFKHKLLSNEFQLELLREATGSTVIGIKGSRLKKLLLSTPPLQEQEKIANMLSTWDKAIENIEKLIKEKEIQKKGLMQELLTGKTRLPGFDGGWKEVKLGEVTERVSEKNEGKTSNVLTISADYGLVNQEEYFTKQIASKNLDNYTYLKNGEFAYNKSYSKGYPMGAIKMLELYEDGVVSSLYICFRAKDNVDTNYLKQYFDANMFSHEIFKVAQEGARNHGLLNIGIKDFFNIKLPLPPLPEQKAIAQILSTADKEIELLKQLLENKKEEKKGLMQLLLTGIVRV